MNRDGHLIWSELILIIILSSILLFLLRDYGLWDVFLASAWSVGFFLLGCAAPDFDHHLMQKKFFFLRPLKGHTTHRGHWHSLGAMGIYGFLIFPLTWLFQLVYWWFPIIAGMVGWFSHLFEDQLMKLIKGNNARKTLKLW